MRSFLLGSQPPPQDAVSESKLVGKTKIQTKGTYDWSLGGSVGFSGSLRVDPLEFGREEIRANISQKLDKYITV